jgi:hypothetical protein
MTALARIGTSRWFLEDDEILTSENRGSGIAELRC